MFINKKKQRYLQELEFFFTKVKDDGYYVSENLRNDGILFFVSKTIYNFQLELYIRNRNCLIEEESLNYTITYIESDEERVVENAKQIFFNNNPFNLRTIEFIGINNYEEKLFMRKYIEFLGDFEEIHKTIEKVDILRILEKFILKNKNYIQN